MLIFVLLHPCAYRHAEDTSNHCNMHLIPGHPTQVVSRQGFEMFERQHHLSVGMPERNSLRFEGCNPPFTYNRIISLMSHLCASNSLICHYTLNRKSPSAHTHTQRCDRQLGPALCTVQRSMSSKMFERCEKPAELEREDATVASKDLRITLDIIS